MDHKLAREHMVAQQLVARGICNEHVLRAMNTVPRHQLVPNDLAHLAYTDQPLAIGCKQTISQPYIVAAMTELARVGPGSRVLDVGTGSGYQAAILAELGAEVCSIEIVAELARLAARNLKQLGYSEVTLHIGDGSCGCPEHAPFDAIIAAAAPPRVPSALQQQLVIGGRLVLPVGSDVQELVVIERTADGFRRDVAFPVRFVPMVGAGIRPHM